MALCPPPPNPGGKSVAAFWICLSCAGPHPVRHRLMFLGVCTRAVAMSNMAPQSLPGMAKVLNGGGGLDHSPVGCCMCKSNMRTACVNNFSLQCEGLARKMT